ncbi:hypothetical protein OYC64_006650 [Pagothenia borchgrevinki]|uniref:Deoxyribonuclease n=1 Tax=Pagothenia borchgrevinki TaxID=8213 RepID=A0ABD2GJS5_PAGBO
MRLLCALGLLLALLHVTSCLLIGAFNIRQFGPGKFDKPEAIKIITKIVQRYDIILIQEVRCNHDLSVPNKLLDLVNKGTTEFSYIVSEPLGPGIYKERYLFLYRFQKVTVTDSFQYEGKGFMRPPSVVKFSSTQTGKEFVLIPIHTSPLTAAQAAKKTKESKEGYVYKSTVEELDALVDVVAAVEQRWKNNNIMVLGDFNADGTFVTKKDWKNIRLFTNTYFHWLIKDGVDTTVAAKSSNTYDRIVVTTEMEKGVEGRAEVFNFKTNYDLTQAQAEDVSDHFPVEVRLKP